MQRLWALYKSRRYGGSVGRRETQVLLFSSTERPFVPVQLQLGVLPRTGSCGVFKTYETQLIWLMGWGDGGGEASVRRSRSVCTAASLVFYSKKKVAVHFHHFCPPPTYFLFFFFPFYSYLKTGEGGNKVWKKRNRNSAPLRKKIVKEPKDSFQEFIMIEFQPLTLHTPQTHHTTRQSQLSEFIHWPPGPSSPLLLILIDGCIGWLE